LHFHPVPLSFGEGWGEDKKKNPSFLARVTKTRGDSRTGEAKATFEIKRRKPSGLQVKKRTPAF